MKLTKGMTADEILDDMIPKALIDTDKYPLENDVDKKNYTVMMEVREALQTIRAMKIDDMSKRKLMVSAITDMENKLKRISDSN